MLVKTYEMGKLSPQLHSLVVGDSLEVRGPVGHFKYTKNAYKKMGFIAGGTGLTPCLQVIRCLLEGPERVGDHTQMVLFFQNRTEEDILLKDVLDKLVAQNGSRLQVLYFLSNASTPTWGSTGNEKRGYINAEVISQYMQPSVTQYVSLCGPGGFTEAMGKLLTEAGHTEESMFVW